jgi:transcriptional regulator with XRE-family HTH domain
MDNYDNNKLGRILKQRRIAILMTRQELAAASGVSPAHLGRIEAGERFPSARTLRKIAEPLGFGENKLFILAGFLSPQTPSLAERAPSYSEQQLDPNVARILAEEPVEVQRTVIGILAGLKRKKESILVDEGGMSYAI